MALERTAARLVPLIRAHRSTLVFANSRRLAERLASALNEVAGEEIALAHHGSVARERRSQIEERLKRGELPAVVATSSLELGIDMGAIDLVVQIEAPPSVAAGLQRIGRAGHSVGAVSVGVIFPKHKGDLLPCAAAVASMRVGHVEATFYPRNPLDVLAQQVVAIASDAPIGVDDLYTLVRGAAPFADLPRRAFDGVLDMLSGRYPSHDFAGLRPRLTWDRKAGVLQAREGARRLAIVNGGTIPDRGLYGVFLAADTSADASLADGKTARRVGELDEEMVFELRPGEVFLLGASSWRAEQITHDRVLVTPAAGEPGKMPFWHGDRPGRPIEFGKAIGALTRELALATPAAAKKTLANGHGLGVAAANDLTSYLAAQKAATGELPTDRSIVVERFIDDLGDWRVCVLSPFGARVHAPWATAVAERLRATQRIYVEPVWSDDGMVFRMPESSEPPPTAWFFPAPDEVEATLTAALDQTALFATHFRECAARALLLPRRRPGERTPLWAQRKRAADLLSVAKMHPDFPILLETYRECLRDVFDMPGLVDLLRQIEERRITVTTIDSRAPSAFATSLLFSFVANFIYDGDAPLAERRAQALSIDQAQLRELLGEAELRSLLDPEAIVLLEQSLSLLAHPARHADAVHDMLLAIGDLTTSEVRARTEPPEGADAWLGELARAGRIANVSIAGETRWIAMEDAGRVRDALGIPAPSEAPEALLAPAADPMGDLVGRYARTHGPFVAADVAARFGVSVLAIEPALAALEARGRVTAGEFLAQGRTADAAHPVKEYCDVGVLRTLRGKSLAKLRRAVEPVDEATYARFELVWQLPVRHGPSALRDAIAQLEGYPVPASVLESEILPARVPGYRTWDLDALSASGEIVWAGIQSLGPRDGRIALYLADHEPLLAAPATTLVEGEAALRIRELLGRRGAVFFAEIARELGGFGGEIVKALWDMVWAGEVTNDTLEPLRSFLRGQAPAKDARGRRRHALTRTRPPTEGRWSLRASRRQGNTAPTETQRRAALARSLLDRYGVVTREAVHAEGITGGFSAVYEVLKAMEEAGRVRRGYFVAGRGATQFALPGADDRLRSLREAADEPPVARIVAATDPANPYGASLPWPGPTEGTGGAGAPPQRAAGALVVLWDGALLGWLGKRGQALLTFLPREEPLRERSAAALAAALAALVDKGQRGVLLLSSIDGADARDSALGAALENAGFLRGADGWMRRRPGLVQAAGHG